MANFLAAEIAYSSIVGALGLWWLWGWQWFFWGIILVPIVLCIGLCIPVINRLIISLYAVLWALPFIFLGTLGIDAAYVFAAVAFFYCFWVHRKALVWFGDLSNDDGESNTW